MTIYANSAGTSWPKPPEVHEAVRAALTADPSTYGEILAGASAMVAEFLSLPDPARFVFTSGCTSALDVAISDLPWSEGDAIVTSSLEHEAVVRPVRKLSLERGVEHSAAPYCEDGGLDPEWVRDRLAGGDVRLVALSAISNVTGQTLPIREIAALAHEHGALCLIDAAQAVGTIPFDVAALGCDIVAFAGHKGPLGPQGIGGLWAAAHLAFARGSAACAIGIGEAQPEATPMPGYCELGGANIAGAAGVAAGMRWLRDHDHVGVGRRYAATLRRAIASLSGCRIIGPAPDGAHGSATSILIDALPVAAAESAFAGRGVTIRAGHHCAEQATTALGCSDGTIRISFGPMSDEGDPARVAEVVAELTAAAAKK